MSVIRYSHQKPLKSNSAISMRNHLVMCLILEIILLLVFTCTVSSRVSDKIYSVLQSNHYCSRRLNATHQVGCTSELGGNFGIVWLVEHDSDLDHVLAEGPTPPYIVILRREHYTRKNLLTFKDRPERVSGVVLFDDDTKSRKIPMSPEFTCPNKYAGLYVNDTQYDQCRQNEWQEQSPISGLLYDDFPYPIFLINHNESIYEIESCFKNNNIAPGTIKKQDTYPLCGMQLDSFMMAAGDTQNCLNSRSLVNEITPVNNQRCNVIDNDNVFAYFKPTHGPLNKIDNTDFAKPSMVERQSIVLVVAKLSSLSMFSEISPGADSTITSIVTLLAAAEALGRVKNSTDVRNSKRNIAFAIIDSEPFDYTGSSRLIYSMLNDSFPNYRFRVGDLNYTDAMMNLNLTSIDYLLNLDQLAIYSKTSKIYLHTDPRNENKNKEDNIISIMKKNSVDYKIKFDVADQKLPIPPSSVQMFIKNSLSLVPEDRLYGAVLSNYEKKYSNAFYHSIYDDSHNIDQVSRSELIEHITRVSSLVAKSAYQLAFQADIDSKTISADSSIVGGLIECYLVRANCSLFTEAWRAGQQLPPEPVSTYKDPTRRSDDMNGAIVRNLLLYFIGEQMKDLNVTRCNEENSKSVAFDYEYVNGQPEPVTSGAMGLCIRSQVVMSQAQSPAYAVTEDGITVDQRYPAWTVSYNNIRYPVRVFIKPSPLQQWSVFFFGILVTVVSVAVIHKVKDSISKLDSEAPGTST